MTDSILDISNSLSLQVNGTECVRFASDGAVKFSATTLYESAALGTALATSTGWTSTGWTGDFATGFTHTTGNTTSLSKTVTGFAIGDMLQVSFTITGRTTGSITVSIGGQVSVSNMTLGAYYYAPKTLTLGDLTFIPTSDFNGTITSIVVKPITAGSSAVLRIMDSTGSAGNAGLEIRTNLKSLTNLYLGSSSGLYTTTGGSNLGIGAGSLQYNTSGNLNTALGAYALRYNTIGYGNVAIGQTCLQNNTTGTYNMGIGSQALVSNTTGTSNVGVGAGALSANTTGSGNISLGAYSSQSCTSGSNNIALGSFSLYKVTTTSGNVGIGYNAGYYLADGTTSNQTPVNSLYLGQNTRSGAAGSSNEIVIGASTTGSGTNTVTLGNTSITNTILRGSVRLGTFSAAPTSPVPAAGDTYFNSTDFHFYGYNGTTWKQLDN